MVSFKTSAATGSTNQYLFHPLYGAVGTSHLWACSLCNPSKYERVMVSLIDIFYPPAGMCCYSREAQLMAAQSGEAKLDFMWTQKHLLR